MATTSSTHQTPSTGAQIFKAIYEIGFSSAAGALAGYLFNIINPMGGAVFGASMSLSRHVTSALAERFCMDQTALKVTAYLVSFIASIAVGVFSTTAAGFPLTTLGAVGMVLAMVVSNCFLGVMLGGAGCCASCLGGAGLALRERFC